MGGHRVAGSRGGAAERGFVLVGVVIFVLALTILGLSLFSLSSYEAQFLQRSLEDSQAFYTAMSGIERTRFALSTGEQTLAQAKQNLPPGVVYARAYYRDTNDSLGAVVWNDTTKVIEIRVMALAGRTRRMFEGDYLPVRGPDFYKRLMTVTSPGAAAIQVNTRAPYDATPTDRHFQTWLNGEVWQNSPDLGWNALAQGIHPVLKKTGLPPADVASFFAEHWTNAVEVRELGASNNYSLTATPAQPRFYRSSLGGGESSDPDYAFRNQDSQPEITINVSGTVMWLVRQGMRFDYLVRVYGNPADRLIIVGSPNTAAVDPLARQTGIWFFGGLDSPIVPVILVSDARVVLEHFNNQDLKSTINYLSIYSDRVLLMGPLPPNMPPLLAGRAMTLLHPVSMAPNFTDPIIDDLYAKGVLPNTQAGTGNQLRLVAGTWREVTESNPD